MRPSLRAKRNLRWLPGLLVVAALLTWKVSTLTALSAVREPGSLYKALLSEYRPQDGERTKLVRESSPEDDAAWQAMVDSVAKEALAYSGEVGILIRDLQTGREWEHHGERLFPSASLIKVPIMSAIFQRIKDGSLRLDTKLTLRRRLRVGGSGSLKWHRDGTVYTVRELLERMIADSDNTATKMLISYVGFYYLQRHFEKLGMVYTEIHPEGMRLQSGRVPKENYTTAREMGDLMEKIYRGGLVDQYSSELMLEMMMGVKHKSRLAKDVPTGWKLAHKTGTLRQACHDAGIFFTPNGDYLVVVLTGKNRTYGQAKNFITRVGRQTQPYFRRGQVDLAKSF